MNVQQLEIGTKIFEVKEMFDVAFDQHFLIDQFELRHEQNSNIISFTLFFLFHLEKYDIVGRLLKPGESPSVYPQEEPTASNSTEENFAKKNE